MVHDTELMVKPGWGEEVNSNLNGLMETINGKDIVTYCFWYVKFINKFIH